MRSQHLPREATLSTRIIEILTDRIRSGRYTPESQLPSENELADEFGVSRTTVRNAISALAARGLVVRRQGIGTFASRLATIANPLNIATDFGGLLQKSGHQFEVQVVKAEFAPPDPELATALGISTKDRVLTSYKIFTAEGLPVIYCINSLPGWLLNEDLVKDPMHYATLTDPLYEFLEEHCSQRVEYHVARIKAGSLQGCQFDYPVLPDPGTTALIITEVAYNADERPLWHAHEFFPGDHITFEVVRQRDTASR